MEGMRAAAIARGYPKIDRFFLLGRTGFVSDDTEQSALVAQSLARHPREKDRFARAFQRSLLGWFLRLPWGIGLGTLRACVRIAVGFRRSGVSSAGNGAAMRAAIVGAFFFDAPARRREWADELARVTHTDQRAVEGARFVAELAAHAMGHDGAGGLEALVEEAVSIVEEPSLREAIQRARRLANDGAPVESASKELGSTGFVLHTVAITTFCLLRFGHDPELAIVEAIRAGGDTDSNAAIVGAWMGAVHGESALPVALMANLHDRDWFTSPRTMTLGGPSHLRALAKDLERARDGTASTQAKYSWLGALLRNAALYPVVLMHAFRCFFEDKMKTEQGQRSRMRMKTDRGETRSSRENSNHKVERCREPPALRHEANAGARTIGPEEAAFLRKYRPADFPRPSVTVDIVAFSIIDAELRVLLIRRGEHPYKGAWALPGGFVRVGEGHRDQGEDLDAAAARELEEETNLRASDVYLDQLGAFGQAGRDPRMRVITVAYYALVRPDLVPLVKAGGDASAADWISVGALPSSALAFDHEDIIQRAVARVADRIDASSIAASLVPKTFTTPELRHVHAVLTGKPQDPGNFRRKFERMLEDGVIERAPGKRITASKPALVYRFRRPMLDRSGP